MPPKLDDATVGKMVLARALDYNMAEIADWLDVSRNTVSRRLKDVREEAEEGDKGAVVIKYILIADVGNELHPAVDKGLEAFISTVDGYKQPTRDEK